MNTTDQTGKVTQMSPKPEPEPNNHSIMMAFPEPEPPPMPTNYGPTMAVLSGLLGSFIITESIIILVAIGKGKPKQSKPLTHFITNLTIADLVAGIQLMWFNFFQHFLAIKVDYLYLTIMCAIWLVAVCVSILGLFHFALHRLKLVFKDVAVHETKKNAMVKIVTAWILPSLVLVVPPAVGWNCGNCMEECELKCSFLLYPFTKGYVLMIAILLYIAIISLFFIYGWIFYAVHQKIARVKKNQQRNKKELKLLKTILILLLVFSICFIPITIILTMEYNSMYDWKLVVAFQIAALFSFFNSASHPFLYIWKLQSMRDAVWRSTGMKHRVSEYNNALRKATISKFDSRAAAKSEVESTSKTITEIRPLQTV